MKNLKEKLSNIFIISYVIIISYVMIINNYIFVQIYQIPEFIIPIVFFVSVVFFCYHYLKVYFKSKQMEYEFTSIVNHTFRTPLTRIIWFTKELEKDMPTNEKLLYLQNINNATTKVLDIVDLFAGVKSINDTSGYVFEATSLRDMVEKVIVKYREEINKKNIELHLSTFNDIPMITIDLKKITFVIDSLIENAIYYTPSKGKILVDAINRGNYIELYVSDTGMGLSILEKMRIFSKFFRTKKSILMNPDGMGLKLYLSKKIIERHNGEIYAKSHGTDKGTTFFIKLPFSRRSRKSF